VATLAAIVAAMAWGFASAAVAQTGTPVCTTLVGTQDAGTHVVGSRFSIRFAPVCALAPGDVVLLSVNDVDVAEKLADSTGGVTVTMHVESDTRVQLEDPVPAAIHLGANTLKVSGFSPSANAVVRQTAVFNVVAATPVSTTPTPKKLAFTGAGIAGMVALASALVAVGTVLVLSRRRRVDPFQA